jgi:putative transposase
MHCVTTEHRGVQNAFQPQSKNIASIIRGYKSAVTKRSRIILPEFAWQQRYYDHIIRNNKAHFTISKYIQENAENWNADCFS